MSNLETIYLLPQKYQLHNFIVVVTFILSHTCSIVSFDMCVCYVPSVMSDFVALRTVAHQAPLSLGFSRQEYWSRLPCPAPGGLPDPGTESMSLISPALAAGFFTSSTTWKALVIMYIMIISYLYILQNDHCSKPSSHPSDSLSKGQMYNMVLLALVTMLCVTCPGLINFITGSLYLWTCSTHSGNPFILDN